MLFDCDSNISCSILETFLSSKWLLTNSHVFVHFNPILTFSSFLLNFVSLVALRTCNLLSVRANYCPATTHTTGQAKSNNNNSKNNNNNNNSSSNRNNNTSNSSSSSSSSSVGYKSDAMLSGPPLLDFARSPAFSSTIQRSMSYSAVGELCGNDTDHNTTNSNSDNDSDSKSFSRGKNFQHNHSTDSEASATPSLLISASATSISPLPAKRLAVLTVPGLNGLENKIGGLGVFSVGKEGSNNVSTFASLKCSDKGSVGVEQVALKRETSDPKCSPGSYHLTYQTISYSNSSSTNDSALPSPRDQDIPLPL